MTATFRIGTSGYSYSDWVGPVYPPGTRSADMLAEYVRRFRTVELNFTFYRMPVPRTLAGIAARTPPGFDIWVKANQETTHRQNRDVAAEYLAGIEPLREAGKLAGVLLQFPQSFHRTTAHRRFLAGAIEDLSAVPLAVEFRHRSWDRPETLAGLRERGVTLAVPDAPDIRDLYRPAADVTTPVGYLRLHSRDAGKWYAGSKARYDYHYADAELAELARAWRTVAEQAETVYVFFNNCHGGQAVANAEAFARVVENL
jgi:uncharacterized protein YecE (DUF72 family)